METSKQEGDMRSLMIRALVVVVLAALCLPARAQAPDKVLVNGKIVTVDGQFRIAQALAIRGQRIVAVGTTAEIERLKSPATQTIDLNGRTVIPGLIDNHADWIRAAEHWHQDVQLAGVTLVAAQVPLPEKEKWLENTRKLAAELNAMGITTWLDAGGRGMTPGHYDSYKYLSDRGELNVRAFWTTIRQAANPEQAEQV